MSVSSIKINAYRNKSSSTFIQTAFQINLIITMKLIALNLVLLAIFVKFSICSFSTFFSEYSLGNEDDYYNEYPGADYEVEKIPLAAVPRRPRGRLGGNRAYRQLFSPFARPAPSSSGFLSQFTTSRPTWTPYPGT